jgi:hypothetical protein
MRFTKLTVDNVVKSFNQMIEDLQTVEDTQYREIEKRLEEIVIAEDAEKKARDELNRAKAIRAKIEALIGE